MLERDVRPLTRFVNHESWSLVFSVSFGADDSRVDAETAARLLQMSPEERKRPGTSKTTLWYAKRDLRRGKPRALYAKVVAKLGGPYAENADAPE